MTKLSDLEEMPLPFAGAYRNRWFRAWMKAMAKLVKAAYNEGHAAGVGTRPHDWETSEARAVLDKLNHWTDRPAPGKEQQGGSRI